MKKMKVIVWAIDLVLIAGLAFLMFSPEQNKQNNYRTYTVKAQSADSFTGVVQATDKQTVDLQPKASDETLMSTNVQSGQAVVKGQVLASFYKDMTGEINNANLEIKQAQLANQEINKQSTKSTDDQIELDKNQVAINTAQAQLTKLHQEQNRTVIAPLDGVYFKDSEGHSFVYGKPVIQGSVNEFSLDKIKLGQEVTVVKNDGTQTNGHYSEKDQIPYSDSSVSYYHFQVEAEDLPYGMHVQIKNATLGYLVPKKAIWAEDTVYLLKNGKKHKKVLKITKHDQEFYVKKGLKAGDKLVLF